MLIAIVMNEDLCSSFFIGRPRAGRWIGCYFFSAIRTAQTLGPGLAEQSRRNDAPLGRKGREGLEGGRRGQVEREEGGESRERAMKKKQNRRGQETRVKEQGSNGSEQDSPPLNKFGAPL